MVSSSEKHFPTLDGLRGLAALMLVAFHSTAHYVQTNTFDKAYLRATSMLWTGVDLFFVLSGFLITNILLDSKRSSNYFRAFYGRRFLRIFPLYYSFLAIIYFLLPALGSHLPKNLTDVQAWQWTYTANINLALHGWPDGNIAHLWTLAIEEQFYLLWPLAVFFIHERHLKKGIVAFLIAIPFLRAFSLSMGLSSFFIYFFTVFHVDALLLGAIVSIALKKGPDLFPASIVKVLDWVIVGIVFGFLFAYCVLLRNDQFIFNYFLWPHFLQSFAMTLIPLPMAYTVLRAVSSAPNTMQKVLSFKYLRISGKYSYALYVLHVPICIWAGTHFPVPGFLQNLSPAWSFEYSIYMILIQFILSIIAAVISWNILEKHFLKLKKYFPYKLIAHNPDRLSNETPIVDVAG